MNKFVLAENPMRVDDGETYIIHLLNPIAIIECIEGMRLRRKGDGDIFETFSFINSDNITEYWTLSVFHFFTTDFISEPEAQAKPLLKRAWRWYRSYMQWEDKNGDEYGR